MLEYLQLNNVGPAPEMELELAPRLNLITGDNGLGKSFLLDVAWWALTRKWPRDLNPGLASGYAARPSDVKQPATIRFRLTTKTGGSKSYESTYVRGDEAWTGRQGRPWNPGLVIYAHADGGFSVWDPARNYWKTKGKVDIQDRLPGYVFSAGDVWNGLSMAIDESRVLACRGLLADWASWIREKGADADRMAAVLEALSLPDEPLRPGPVTRLSVNDARDIPTVTTPQGTHVPIVHASAGVRRIAALAYMLMWSWNEHRLAAESLGEDETHQVVLLVDEIESHLHPRWQRTILRSLLEVARQLHESATIQLLVVTHSPLILASAEPRFDAVQDAWFDLDLDKESGRVELEKREFRRHGEVSSWLVSEAFDLGSARSLEAEEVLEEAAVALSDPGFDRERAREIDTKLRKVLGELDPFWVRWRFVGEKKGWLPDSPVEA
jgi:hypothetical protein